MLKEPPQKGTLHREIPVTKSDCSFKCASALLAVIAVGSGLVLSGQVPQTVGSWASTGAVADSRDGSASAALVDGRTLIAGGYAGGVATSSVVIYNPLDNTFLAVGQMTGARVGHTATSLKDGRVLIAGGEIAGVATADLEIFDPAAGSSTMVGTMSAARAGHGAARLSDGTVLLVGGSDGAVALATAEVFDPATGAATGVGALAVPRSGASATPLIDGRVLVAGGSDGVTDLASAEIYNPFASTFEAVPTSLSIARSGHSAILLPHNAGVLLAGGKSTGAPVQTADLFLPAQFPDPYSSGMGHFAATGSMTVARTQAASGPGAEGFAFVAGGGSADAEKYRFATIKTDKDDYEPGERAVISGSGWQPNEIVTLLFQEDPAVHEDYVLQVQADTNGDIYWDQWAPEEHDLGVRFYLLATDSRSRAQVTFTDARVISEVSLTHNSITISCSTGPCTPVGAPLVVAPGASISASVKSTLDGTNANNSSWRATGWSFSTSSTPPAAGTENCADTADHDGPFTPATQVFTEVFTTTAPLVSGTYFAHFRAYRANPVAGQCQNQTGAQAPSQPFTITSAITVTAPSYSVNDVVANEGNAATTTFTFTVTKSVSGAASSVQYATANGSTNPATGGATCTAGVDYITIAPTTLNFTAAQTTRSFDVTVCGDSTFELDETFFVNLSSPSAGTTIDDGEGIGTITNEDAQPSFTIGVATVSEGNLGMTDLVFTVTKTGSTELNATAEFDTANGTTNPASGGATCGAGVDYETQAGTLNFAPTDASKTITVKVCGDAVFELDETFLVNLSNATAATIADGQGLGTISNDDAAPTLSISDVILGEGDSGATDFTFSVTKTGETEVAATVEFATADGTTLPATGGVSCGPGVDYESQSGSLSFAPAEGGGTVTVKVCGEAVFERDQTFFVNLSNPSAATIADDQGLGTISNDDSAPVLNIGNVSAAEGNGGTTDFSFSVTKSGQTEVDASVDFATALGATNPATAGGACAAGVDYESKTGTLTIAAATAGGSIVLKVCGDSVFEFDQTFQVNLTNPTDATLGDGSAVGVISNDDAAPTLSIGDVTQAEGDSGTTDFTLVVTKSGDTEVNATVDFATSNGTTNPATGGATCGAGVDYETQTGTLTFLPLDGSESITVKVCGEAVFELDQTFFVNLSNPSSATITDGQGLGTITNDDAAPMLSINDVSLAEGNSGVTNFIFTVTKAGATEVNATVDFATADGTTNPATGGAACGVGVDYETQTGSLNFAPADGSMIVTVKVCGEAVFELNQTFFVNLTNPASASITDDQGLGTITNDDAAPTLSIANVTLAEVNAGTTDFAFTVTKTGATEVNATVDFATAAGVVSAATAGALCGPGTDYETLSGTLTFMPADATQPVTIKVCGDLLIELSETFRVILSNAGSATIATGTATGTITNDDFYTFTGFFSPVENAPALNGVNAGRAIPLKWELHDPAGTLVLDLATVTGITYVQIACGSESVDPMEYVTDDSGTSELRLTATGYHFNWKTEKGFANRCYELRIALNDSTVHEAKFKFKK